MSHHHHHGLPFVFFAKLPLRWVVLWWVLGLVFNPVSVAILFGLVYIVTGVDLGKILL